MLFYKWINCCLFLRLLVFLGFIESFLFQKFLHLLIELAKDYHGKCFRLLDQRIVLTMFEHVEFSWRRGEFDSTINFKGSFRSVGD